MKRKNHKTFLRQIACLLLFFVVATTGVYAQQDKQQGKRVIKGQILDAKTKEPLIGASVVIEGTDNGTYTDVEGRFELKNVSKGSVSLLASYLSYKTLKKDVLEDKFEAVISFELEPDDLMLGEAVAYAKYNREQENTLLLEQKNSIRAIRSVGAAEMSRKGIGNAEQAVAQVSGVSKQDGVKNVFVRGLGDRYNLTLLNGFPVVSDDPEYKNISLDLFESNMIKSVDIDKVFSGRKYGDVGGAVIDIDSKELIGDYELSVGLSGGVSNSIFSGNFMQVDGINYFGKLNNAQPGADYKTNWGFTNSLNPHKYSLPINHGYEISGGKQFLLGKNKNPLSFYLLASHSSDFSSTDERSVQTNTTGEILQDLSGKKQTQEVKQIALGNLNFLIPNKLTISYNVMMIHNSSAYYGKFVGEKQKFISTAQPSEYEYQGAVSRQQVEESLLLINQLSSEIALAKSWRLNVGFSHNFLNSIEPDRRENNFYRVSENEYGLLAGSGVQVRNFTDLKVNDLNARMVVKYSLPEKFREDGSNIRFGYNGRFVYDRFSESEYTMTAANGKLVNIETMNMDDIYNQQNLSDGIFSMSDKINSRYSVEKYINAGFVEATYMFSDKWIAEAAVRLDHVALNINYNINSGNVSNDSKSFSKPFILPMVNLLYKINPKHALRLGLSKTYTLPQSKEMSPYQYVDITFKSQGNPDLKPSDNYNADLKWDFYMSQSELLSVTGFFKYIKDPIARIEANNAGGYLTYRNISKYAIVGGAELEVRKNIFEIKGSDNILENRLSVGLNASYIYSDVALKGIENTPDKNSQLEGASPFIGNLDLSYHYATQKNRFTQSVTFGYFSDRVYTIGTTGFNNVIEKGLPTLNFVSSAKFGKHASLKLKVSNITNSTSRLVRQSAENNDKVVLNQYKKGLRLSLGFTYDF